MQQRGCFDRPGISLELGHGVDKSLSVADIYLFGILFIVRSIDPHDADHDLHIGSFKLTAEVLDKVHKISAILLAAGDVEHVVESLEPYESFDFVSCLLVILRVMPL